MCSIASQNSASPSPRAAADWISATDLDEERKANMVSNLLVVLCGEENARPVVNTGSLYS